MPASLAKKSSTAGKRTTKVRPAPDFKKLHQKFEQKFQQGKACTKKPSTVVSVAVHLSSQGRILDLGLTTHTHIRGCSKMSLTCMMIDLIVLFWCPHSKNSQHCEKLYLYFNKAPKDN